VIAVGSRSGGFRGNNMLYHPDVHQFTDIESAVPEVDDWVDEFYGVEHDEDDEDDDEIEDEDVDESGSVITTADIPFGFFGVTLDESAPVSGS